MAARKRILFVDDEPLILEGLQRAFRPMRGDWDMLFADSGALALDVMAREPVDVVVSDMHMSGQGYSGSSGGTNILDLTGAKDRLGNWTYYTYDPLRRLTAVTNALNYVTRYNYCTCGTLLESVTDAQNHSTSFTYDLNGHLLLTTLPDNSWTANNYDAVGRLTNVTDSAGSSVLKGYNNQGLLVTVSNSFGLEKAITYDINDQATATVDANGVEVDSTYDALGRVLTRTYTDSGVEHFGYSASGLAAYVNQLGFTNCYGYDAAGRKTSETNANQKVTQFSYTPAGDLLTLTDGKNQTTTWHYDVYGRVTNKLDAASNLIFVYSYDANSRLTGRWTPEKGNTFYAFDAVGNLTQVAYPQLTNRYAYDALNQLTNLVDAVGTNHFTYDTVGHLLSAGGLWPADTVSFVYTNGLRT